MSRLTIDLLALVASMLRLVRSAWWLSRESQPETAAGQSVAAPGSAEPEGGRTGAAIRPIENPPNWVPALAEWAGLTSYNNREGYFRVFFNAATDRIFATDGGSGFALAQK